MNTTTAPSAQMSLEEALAIQEDARVNGIGKAENVEVQNGKVTATLTFRHTLDELSDAIKTVYAHADRQWKDIALSKVRFLCETMHEFTTDDLIRSLSTTFAKTPRLQAAGPIMSKAAKMGWLAKTDRVRTCSRPERNGGTVQIWQSLLFNQFPS